MSHEPPVPTDPDRETAAGRIALWLDLEDLRWVASSCRCGDEASDLSVNVARGYGSAPVPPCTKRSQPTSRFPLPMSGRNPGR